MSQTVERALRILERIASQASTIEEIADFVGVHPTTALRTLQVLESRQFVVRDDRHVFRLGSGLFALANEALEKFDLRSAAGPHLDRLNQEVGHTIHLGVLEGDKVVYVDKRESLNPVRLWSRIGNVAPVHCTALGKVILAHLPPKERDRIVKTATFERLTDNTISSADELATALETAAEQGYAVDHLEFEPFVNCIACPVLGADGRVLGAISITTTTLVCSYEEMLDLRPALAATAEAVSAEYGWRQEPERKEAVA
ncbi:MAG: IclR family transcriptional regulator [Acidimicrobiaceae bacterium]|nr:IclR family transcriptional regulator [Acidimicrobiaceae bacterium]